jgi:hypothetical protein
MFGRPQQALGKIEHLPPLRVLDPSSRPPGRIKPRPAMRASLGLVFDNLVRIAHLP